MKITHLFYSLTALNKNVDVVESGDTIVLMYTGDIKKVKNIFKHLENCSFLSILDEDNFAKNLCLEIENPQNRLISYY